MTPALAAFIDRLKRGEISPWDAVLCGIAVSRLAETWDDGLRKEYGTYMEDHLKRVTGTEKRIKSRSLGGRYPSFGPVVYDRESVTVNTSYRDGKLTVQLNDSSNLERWEKIEIPVYFCPCGACLLFQSEEYHDVIGDEGYLYITCTRCGELLTVPDKGKNL